MTTDHHFAINVRVYIEDTDAGGVVFYVNYLKFMERARTEYLRSLGFPKPALLSDELSIVVRSTSIDYLRSAVLDDELLVTVSVDRVAGASFSLKQQVLRQINADDQELLASADIKLACVSRQRGKPAAFPAQLREAVLTDMENKAS